MKRSALTHSKRAEDILTRTLEIEFTPEDVLTLVISMPALRAEESRLNDISTIEDEDTALAHAAESLVRIVKRWNLENEDGTPAPLTVDFITSELEFYELFVMLTALGDELRKSAEEAGKAAGTSGSSKPSTKPAKKPRKH